MRLLPAHIIPAALLCLCSAPLLASELSHSWQTLYDGALERSSAPVAEQDLLDSFPKEQLLSQAQYPDFDRYSWQDLQLLWQTRQECIAPSEVTPRLAAAIEFELAMCRKQPLPDEWFHTHPALHPAGGSYTGRYLNAHPGTALSPELARQLTLAEPSHPLHFLLAELTPEGADALLSGYRAYLTDDQTLWLGSNTGWHKLTKAQWQPQAKALKLEISNQQQECSLRYSNLCINAAPEASLWLRLALLLSGLIIAGLLIRLAWQKRLEGRERRYILELLTHELRTPVTSLGFSVESLRDEFDTLSGDGQQALWRLISDHQRLAQLTETSKGYLSQQQDLGRSEACLTDFLDHTLEKFQLDYELDNDRELELPWYWLGICLSNLVKNALQHGKAPVRVRVSCSQHLRIEVSDAGEFPPPLKRLLRGLRKNQTSTNMGVGLDIVSRLMRQVGGRLIIERHPTRCTLELPL